MIILWKSAVFFVFVLSLGACATPGARNTDDDAVAYVREKAMNLIAVSIEVGKMLAPNGPDSRLIEEMKGFLVKKLKDPDSALFRNIKVVSRPEGKLVCGEMNAKNSLGGYVGYKPFIGAFLIDLDDLDKVKRTRSPEFYNRIVDAYVSGYREACL
jgi:hypothetical protein